MRPLLVIATLLTLAALPVPAQTVQNPSFETFNPLTANAIGPYNLGPIPNWSISGLAGSWQPSAMAFKAVPDGATVVWVEGILSQDLGAAPAASTTYTLTAYVGNRADTGKALNSSWQMALYAGSTQICSASGLNADIPVGTFVPQSVTCPTPAALPSGDLIVTLSSQGVEAVFDNVSLTAGPVFTFKLAGCCSLTFPMQANPQCTAADGACSIAIQACNTKTNLCVTLNPGDTGVLNVIKSVTLPSTQTSSTVVSTVGP